MTTRRRLAALTLAALSLLYAAPVAAESFVWAAGTSGLVKADLDLTLFRVAGDGGTFDNIADPGITVTEDPAASGFYVIDELPDADADADYVWTLAFTDPDGRSFTYTWPARTRQPQSLVWAQTYQIVPSTATLSVGDTLPSLQMTVTGLSSDPTGASVAFSMFKQSGAIVIDSAAASLSNISSVEDEDTGVVSWSCVLTYEWAADDIDTAGTFYGRFRITFAGGDILTAPPGRTSVITVVR